MIAIFLVALVLLVAFSLGHAIGLASKPAQAPKQNCETWPSTFPTPGPSTERNCRSRMSDASIYLS